MRSSCSVAARKSLPQRQTSPARPDRVVPGGADAEFVAAGRVDDDMVAHRERQPVRVKEVGFRIVAEADVYDCDGRGSAGASGCGRQLLRRALPGRRDGCIFRGPDGLRLRSAAGAACSRTVSGFISCMVFSNLPQKRQGKISGSSARSAEVCRRNCAGVPKLSAASWPDSRSPRRRTRWPPDRRWPSADCRPPARAPCRSGWRRAARRSGPRRQSRRAAPARCEAGAQLLQKRQKLLAFVFFHRQKHAQHAHPVARGIGRGQLLHGREFILALQERQRLPEKAARAQIRRPEKLSPAC